MWHPDPPQGFSTSQGQVIIGRPMIPLYGAPQGVGVGPSGFAMAYEPANWADAAYLQRIPLTINVSQVPSTQNDFVLLINSTFTELIGQTVGSIRIGTSDITVDYEIQKFDDSTGELIAWAKVPSISDADVFYVYFDNPNAPDNQNPFEVWSEYSNVYHLNNDPSLPNSILDSARLQETGNPRATTLLDAKIGKGQDFDQNAVPDPSRIQLLSWNPSTSVSISLWFKTVNSNRGTFFTSGNSTGVGIFCEFQASGRIRYVYRNPPSGGGGTDFNSPATFADNLFHKLVYVYDEAGTRSTLYVDGVFENDQINVLGPQSALDSDGNMGTSSPFGGALSYDGVMDEFQIFVGVQSADRVATEFNNQDAPDTFYSTGTVEAVPAPVDTMGYQPIWFDIDFLQRFPLTINGGQVPSTQNDFPLLINDTFFELIGMTIDDIRFASTDNVQLEYEIQEFCPVTGTLIAWVKKPTVSDGDIIFVYFDNPAAVDEQNPAAVYDSNYKGVYHYSQATGASILDSTINGNDGTPVVGFEPISVPAKIGNGLDCNGGIDLRANFPNSLGNDYTVSIWGKIPASDNRTGANAFNGNQILNADVSGNFDDYIPMAVLNNHMSTFIGESGGAIDTLEGNVVVNTDVFIYIVITRLRGSPGELQIYINGVLDNSLSLNNLKTLTDATFIVFGDGPGTSTGTDGVYDELRLSDIVRSADRILTEFNNQNDQSTFYTKGAAETFPAATIAMGYEE